MAYINKFNVQSIESISYTIGDILTGSKISTMFNQLNLIDNSNESTKWKRLNFVMCKSQETFNCGNKIVEIIEYVFFPTSSWFDSVSQYSDCMNKINKCISFYGLELNAEGKIYKTKHSTTMSEANERYDLLKSKLLERNIHPLIMKFCTKDIVVEDYFSIIIEASKSIYERIRQMTGIELDGNKLIFACFDKDYPIVVCNSLKTETEQNIYNGLRSILISIGQIGRNPRSHTPKIYSYDNLENCLDILNIISFAHKMLDQCFINNDALNKFPKR